VYCICQQGIKYLINLGVSELSYSFGFMVHSDRLSSQSPVLALADPGGLIQLWPLSKISIVIAPTRQMLRLTPVSPRRHTLPVAQKANLA